MFSLVFNVFFCFLKDAKRISLLFQLVVNLIGDGLQPFIAGSFLHIFVIRQVLKP